MDSPSDVLDLLRHAVARRTSTLPEPAAGDATHAATLTVKARIEPPVDTDSHGDGADRNGRAGAPPDNANAADGRQTTPTASRPQPAPPASGTTQPSLFESVVAPRASAPPVAQSVGADPAAAPNTAEKPAARPARTKPRAADKSVATDTLSGHRERLRKRFDRGETLEDYELLELALFRAIPRRDTKPIAKAMVRAFGSFAGALGAPAHKLTEIDGVGTRVVSDLRLIKAAAERFAHSALADKTVLPSTKAVADYYLARLRGAEREEFHILFLDKKNQMLASECAGTGTVDHAPVYPREVARRALAHSASAIVLVHNHPSGDPTPSQADVSMTADIVAAMRPLGISVHDHIVIGESRYVSLAGEGLL